MSRPRRDNHSRKSYDPRRAFGSANYLTTVTGGGLTIPRTGLIFYAKAPGMVDTIGLSANALWDALPATHRSIYFSDPLDSGTKLDDATIITNIETSPYYNNGGGLVGHATEKAQYEDGTSEEVIKKVLRFMGLTPFLVDISKYYFVADSAPAALTIDTYDTGNQLTHPGVWDFGAPWNGYRYWMAATPFNGSNTAIENPCIYASNDLSVWVTPDGLTNPIEPQPGGGGYNSDTHLVYGNDGYLYCLWRSYVSGSDAIMINRSSDGVAWNGKETIINNDPVVRRVVSPAAIWNGSRWVLYGIDFIPSPNVLVKYTATSLYGPWSGPVNCSTNISGFDPWHIDVKYHKGLYAAACQVVTLGASDPGRLFFGYSTNGIDFNFADYPLISQHSEWHTGLYRSSIIPKEINNMVTFDLLYAGVGASWRLGTSSVRARLKTEYDAEPSTAIGMISPYLGSDIFDRADGALGSTSSGKSWVSSAGSPVVSSNAFAASTAANTRAYFDSGVSDGFFEAKMSVFNGAQGYLVFRLSDGSNYWRVGVNAGGNLLLQKIVAGGATTLVTGAISVAKNNFRIGVNCTGNDITIYINGSRSIKISDSFNSGARNVGLQCADTATRFSAIWWRSALD